MGHPRRHLSGFVILAVLAATPGSAQRQRVQIGGASGDLMWSDVQYEAVALDDTTAPGSLQPKELRPWENVMVGPGLQTHVYGVSWQEGKTGGEAFGFQIGVNPRFWHGNAGREEATIIDNDPETAISLRQLVSEGPTDIFNQILRLQQEVWTFDFVVQTPINRIVFFPRQTGIDKRGIPNKEGTPRAYRISMQSEAEPFLLDGAEPLPMKTLATVVAQTRSNTKSQVDIRFPLQAVRFLRLDLSLAAQFYSLAEFQVYGAGVSPEVTFVSSAIDFGEPVNFGEITYTFRQLRRNVELDTLAADPEGVAHLLLETRTGTDATPLAYLVVDDFGRDRETTQAEWETASLPRRENTTIRYPGQRSSITEDHTNWSPWSSPYRTSGEQNRSPDGRQYLQLRATFVTEDVLSMGRLDSLAFEFSPRLATSVRGEVSLAGADAGAAEAGQEPHPAEAPAGELRTFYYDLAATFSSATQGFDAVHLNVPVGSRLVGLEMGEAPVAVVPDSLRPGDGQSRDGDLWVFFPSHRITRDANRPVRLTLESSLFNSSTFFTGKVIDTESENLPQSVDGGNARDDVPTNSLQVFATQTDLRVLDRVRLLQPALTPNGDGVNDRVGVAFNILVVDAARITVDVLDLSGRTVASLTAADQIRSGQLVWWDGRDGDQKLVPPGLYVIRVEVETQTEDSQRLLTVPVIY